MIHGFLEGGSPLAKALKPWEAMLGEQVNHVHIHPLVQLLLTAGNVARPQMMEHAVAAMLLAGAMVEATQGSVTDIRHAMTAGFLHDIGEIYIQPDYLDKKGQLTLEEYKHLAVHPRIAQILLSSGTDYAPDIARAVGEHHERLDGSGYPAAHHAANISTLGRVLAIVEVVLGISKIKTVPLTRASFALRFIPGEFDLKYAGFIFDLANNASEVIQSFEAPSNMHAIDEVIRRQQEIIDMEASFQALQLPSALYQILSGAKNRLSRLQVGWNSVGLWGINAKDLTAFEKMKMDMVNRELLQRLREIEREALLLAQKINPEERSKIAFLWKSIV